MPTYGEIEQLRNAVVEAAEKWRKDRTHHCDIPCVVCDLIRKIDAYRAAIAKEPR